MKAILITLLLFGFYLSSNAQQVLSPDDYIDLLKKDEKSIVFTFPGWFIRSISNNALKHEQDKASAEIIKQLTHHIKKLRFVLSPDMDLENDLEFQKLKNYLKEASYESLLSAREEGSRINLWAQFDKNIIKHMLLTVKGDEDFVGVFKIKSEIDFEKLQQMPFYKENKY